MEEIILRRALERLATARQKFPAPNKSFIALIEEVGELAKADLEDEPHERIVDECIDVIVCALRVATEGMDGDTAVREAAIGGMIRETIELGLDGT